MIEEIINGDSDPRDLSLNNLKEDLVLEINYEFYSEKLNKLKLIIGYEKLFINKNLSNTNNDLLSIRRKQNMINGLNFVIDKIDSRLRRLKYIQYEYVEEN